MNEKIISVFHKMKFEYKMFIILFLLFFLITSLVQFVILPFILRDLYWGDGLMKGRDWVGFHLNALENVKFIKTFGFNGIFLMFDRDRVSFVLSLIYLVLSPLPIYFSILSCILYSLGIVMLLNHFKISEIEGCKKYLLLMFFIFPSTLILYTQIHKDVFTFFSLACLVSATGMSRFYKTGLLICTGLFFSWLVRSYQLQVFSIIFLFMYMALWLTRSLSTKKFMLSFLFLMLTTSALTYVDNNYKISTNVSENVSEAVGFKWSKSDFLPGLIERKFYQIGVYRSGMNALKSDNNASIDGNIFFYSAFDVIKYTPRAIQIALLAPFPGFWVKIFDNKKGINSRLERFISTIETSIFYVVLLFFVMASFKNRVKVETVIYVLTLVLLMLPVSFVFSNLGTLYRMRIPYFLILSLLMLIHIFKSYYSVQKYFCSVKAIS